MRPAVDRLPGSLAFVSSTFEGRFRLFGSCDGEPLRVGADDQLSAGPCGNGVDECRQRFCKPCARLDGEFEGRVLDEPQRATQAPSGRGR